MKARLFAGMLLAATTMCAWADTWKINPGVGVGPIALGQEYLQANKYLTPGDAVGNQQAGYLRYKEGVDVECENAKIIQIVVKQTSFNAKGGPVAIAIDGNLRIGSTVAQMEQVLGRGYTAQDLKVGSKQPRETYYAYQSKGIGVLTREGRVVQFAVWRRKG
jgi:hypothetical protein